MADRPIYVMQHNHFDPIWRRCWERTFDHRGQRYRSYSELQERFLAIWIDTASRGATWSEGQAVVLDKYLESHPDAAPAIRGLVRKGVFELTAAGWTVPDTNMPSGETLLRNLVIGQQYFHDTFGVTPSIGWLEDAFGQSAQIPQIFRGCGCRILQRLSYKRVPGDYWKGLDGSVIYIGEPGHAQWVGHAVKIPPCPDCAGRGCEKCDWNGQQPEASHVTDEDLQKAFSHDYGDAPYGFIFVGGEEAVPHPRLPEMLQSARQQNGEDYRFGTLADFVRHVQEEIERVDAPDLEVSPEVEANPVSTGCYVTRIAIKQQFRRLENLVNSTERWAAVCSLLGQDAPDEQMERLWRNLSFAAFHDAITSTHIDAAYAELTEMLSVSTRLASMVRSACLSTIEKQLAASDRDKIYLIVYNSDSWQRDDPVSLRLERARAVPALVAPEGTQCSILDAWAEGEDVQLTFQPPKIGPLGWCVLELRPDEANIDAGEESSGPGTIENDMYSIEISEHGITSIRDQRTGNDVVDTSQYLVNELLLEEDIGHPWGTMQMPSFLERLGRYTTRIYIRKAAHAQIARITGQYKGEDSSTRLLTWQQTVMLYDGVDRITFQTVIDWNTSQRRIRAAFPTGIPTNEGWYSIPYGALKRGPYEPDMRGYPSTNGDWPAVNWVDVLDEQTGRGVALVNTGTPSHKVANGVIFLSLLRSPADSWCLNEPEFYDCPAFDGARDAGVHVFDYVLIPHAGDWRDAGIDRRAWEINNPIEARLFRQREQPGELPLQHSMMRIEATPGVMVTALKKAHKSPDLIVRLAESFGQPGHAWFEIEGMEKRCLTDYLERGNDHALETIELAPWKIVTVRLS